MCSAPQPISVRLLIVILLELVKDIPELPSGKRIETLCAEIPVIERLSTDVKLAVYGNKQYSQGKILMVIALVIKYI